MTTETTPLRGTGLVEREQVDPAMKAGGAVVGSGASPALTAAAPECGNRVVRLRALRLGRHVLTYRRRTAGHSHLGKVR